MNNKDQITGTNRWTVSILRIGMYAALLLILAAFIMFIITGIGYSDVKIITAAQLPQAIADFDPFAIASLAILLLFILAFLPVLTTMIDSITKRDNKLTAITASIFIFLCILLIFVFVQF